MKRIVATLAVLALASPFIGCAEKTEFKKETTVTTPGGSSTTTQKTTVEKEGENPPPTP